MLAESPTSSITEEAFLLSPLPQIIIDQTTQRCLEFNQAFQELFGAIQPSKLWPEVLPWANPQDLEQVLEGVLKQDAFQCPNILLQTGEEEQEFEISGSNPSTSDNSHRVLMFQVMTQQVSQESLLLQNAIGGTATRIGEDYLKYCIETLCEAFEMDLGLIAHTPHEADPGEAHTLAFFSPEEGHLPNTSCLLEESPCKDIYQISNHIYLSSELKEQFPNFFPDENMIGYLGFPIHNSQREVVVHLSLMSRDPLSEPSETEAIFLHIFASRIEAEFERMEMETQLRLATEKAEFANRAKTRFLAHISHELRTPLNAVLGYSQILAGEPSLDEQQSQLVDGINRNGNHLLTLINDVLDMSQIETGKVEVHLQDTNIAELNEDLSAMFRPSIEKHEPGFIFEVDEKTPAIIKTDRDKLRQILANLLSNAFKYAQNGKIKYSVRFQTNPGKQSTIIFEVSDTGPGIAENDIDTLFQPFERLNQDGSKNSISGTGLGLSIARQFARVLKGELSVVSRVGVGTKFSLTLPVTSGVRPTDTTWVRVKAQKSKLSGTVLVVDDNDSSRDIVNQVLTKEGLVVIEARNGQEGVNACIAERPTLVIMDVRMPVLNGPDASRAIREQLGEECPPIICLTGDVLDMNSDSVKEQLFDAIIGKPFQFETLLNAVKLQLMKRPTHST